MATKNQVSGGGFQDALGNVVANGYMLFSLSQDSQVNGSTQIAAGYTVKINLDSSGNIITSPAQYVWPNDVLTPNGTFYNVSVYSAVGQLVWGPNAQQVLSSPSPYNVGAWIPAAVNIGLGGGGAGTVNNFSFTNGGGFTGNVTNPTTNPTLSLTQASLQLPSSPVLSSVQGTGTAILSFTGGSASNQVFVSSSNGTATLTGISAANLVQTVSSNVFTGFNQFVGNNLLLLNLTAATSGLNQTSPLFILEGQYWTGSASMADSWTLENSLGSGSNPVSTLMLGHTGSSGTAYVSMPNLSLTSSTITTSATSGAASALPATPLGYVGVFMIISSVPTTVKIPFYSV